MPTFIDLSAIKPIISKREHYASNHAIWSSTSISRSNLALRRMSSTPIFLILLWLADVSCSFLRPLWPLWSSEFIEVNCHQVRRWTLTWIFHRADALRFLASTRQLTLFPAMLRTHAAPIAINRQESWKWILATLIPTFCNRFKI